MAFINWSTLVPLTKADADIAEPWIVGVEDLQNAKYLRIRATGSWVAIPGLVAECEPNGLTGLVVHASMLIVSDCPIGALIGKFGGNAASLGPGAASPAGAAPGEGQPFGVGDYCVVKVPAEFVGPLFIGFNSLVRPVRVNKLSVTVSTTVPS